MNRSWVRFPQAAQMRPPVTGWAFLYARVACGVAGVPGAVWPGRGAGLLGAPRVFRVPEGPAVGPGCFVRPWAAARPRVVRAASFARRVVSKPGQAPPPPTGTAARPINPSGALHTCGAGSLMCACTSPRSPARPRHRPRASQPGPPIPSAPRLEARPGPPDPPAPSTSVLPGVLMGGSVRCLEDWPGSAAARAIVISHAIPLRHCADSYRSATLRHSCF